MSNLTHMRQAPAEKRSPFWRDPFVRDPNEWPPPDLFTVQLWRDGKLVGEWSGLPVSHER